MLIADSVSRIAHKIASAPAREARAASPAQYAASSQSSVVAAARAPARAAMMPIVAGRTFGPGSIGDWIGDRVDDARKIGDLLLGTAREMKEIATDAIGSVSRRLASLPNEAANALANSLRGPSARELTAGEEAALREIFGDSIDLSDVRIVRGAGYNLDAATAFNIGNNPALTEGDTVYLRGDVYSDDLSATASGRALLAHEFAHVRQYQEMGFGSFFEKYGRDLVAHDLDRDAPYDYQSRDLHFDDETLEGQAAMIGDYAGYLAGDRGSISASEAAELRQRLRGTGLFGL